MRTVFIRALEADDKGAALLAAIPKPKCPPGPRCFEVDAASFGCIQTSPFAYWLSEGVRRLFKTLPSFYSQGREARQGLGTADDFRYVRLWWEVQIESLSLSWRPFVKGGSYSPYFADCDLLLQWRDGGAIIKAMVLDQYGSIGKRICNEEYYFRSGLTWPSRPHRRGGFSCVPKGTIFSVSGMMLFEPTESSLMITCALLNSSAYIGLLHAIMPRGSVGSGQTLKYEVGYLAMIPVPSPSPLIANELFRLSRQGWSLKRRLDTRTETSHAFTLPALLQVKGDTLVELAAIWVQQVQAFEAELATIQAKIDDRCFDLYGIDEADRLAITEGFGGSATSSSKADSDVDAEADDDADDEDEPESSADTTSLVAELVSWAVGIAFGRFDVRVATGARALPPEPEPFDPLPVCSPAMLTGDDGLPLTSAPTGYPLTFPENGILMDDPGHRHDFTFAVRAVFDVVFGTQADAMWQEAAALLDQKDRDLCMWLSSSYFGHHIKRYSKSRRKAPILWQLGVPSGLYSVWLYAHRLTRDSFFQLQNDVVATKLAHEERQLTSLIQQAGGSPSVKERKEIAIQQAFVEELRVLLEEVKLVAPLWNPMLDDGVVLTMAPLWRLVPQHKPWQKELKSKWDELCGGKYDWAHVAMELWPERVVPRCATDRSLAIAHGLEDVFWAEDTDGKWQLRATPTRSVDELIRERTSPAVKAALKSLLDAPMASGKSNGRKGGGRRKAAAAEGGNA